MIEKWRENYNGYKIHYDNDHYQIKLSENDRY